MGSGIDALYIFVILRQYSTMPTGMRGSKFKVTVSLISGRTFKLTCRRKDSFIEFKKSLLECTNMDYWFGQRLLKGGDELDNHTTLGNSGVDRNTVIMVVWDEDQPPPLVDSSDDDNGDKRRRPVKARRRRARLRWMRGQIQNPV